MQKLLGMILLCTLCVTWTHAEENDERVTVHSMFGRGFKIEVKVNGTVIPMFDDVTAGDTVAVQLFRRDYKPDDPIPPEYRFTLCLNNGTNTVEITYKRVEANADDLHVFVRAPGYDKEILDGRVSKDKVAGKLSGSFQLRKKQPERFATSEMK